MTITSEMLKKAVLIIEDDRTINQLLEYVLSEEGFVTRSAFSAEEALALLARTPCDLITLDLGLPGMDGNDFLEALPQTLRHIPVVVITATPQLLRPNDQVCAVINKPFDITFVATQVQTSLETVRQTQVA